MSTKSFFNVIIHRQICSNGSSPLTGEKVTLSNWVNLIFAFSHFFWLSLLTLLLFGIAQNGVGATTITLLQTRVPPQMRGRVMSLNTLLIMGVRPLGDFPASGLIALMGGPLTVLLCASIVGGYSLFLIVGRPVIRSL
jgi:hypothetical protein